MFQLVICFYSLMRERVSLDLPLLPHAPSSLHQLEEFQHVLRLLDRAQRLQIIDVVWLSMEF